MARGRPVDDETRAEAVRLMTEEGWGRNRIARELGIAQAVVTGFAREVGHEFDWRMTDLAVRARGVEVADMRLTLAKAALIRAFEALEAIDAPAVMVHFESGGVVEEFEDGKRVSRYQPGQFREHLLDAPTFSDQRNLATVFGIMAQRAAELTKSLPGAQNGEALSLLDGLGSAIRVYVDSQTTGDLEPGEIDADDPQAEPENVPREAMIAAIEEKARAAGLDPTAPDALPE